MLRALTTLLLCVMPLAAQLEITLPTENHHLFSGKPEKFYMYVDRIFEGVTSKPWLGGSFGYVRTAQRIKGDVLLTKFHEGIDIAPIRRDKAGNPMDLVSSIADGRVVHVNSVSGRSNYGKYVVVEHLWNGSKIYSLYAHLAETTCNAGDRVRIGGVLGRMGYTGAGINRTRAHVHLELALLMSQRFDDWMKSRAAGINYHGNFNGMNLTGCDVARLFLDHRANPDLRFDEWLRSTPVHFKVLVTGPSTGIPDFLARHPWMRVDPGNGIPRSWVIAFSATGQPVSFEGADRVTQKPVVIAVRPSEYPHRYLTRNLIAGEGKHATLTNGGKALVSLLMDDFPSKR